MELAIWVVRSSASLPLLSWGPRWYSHKENAVDLSSAACHCHHCVADFPSWPCCHPEKRCERSTATSEVSILKMFIFRPGSVNEECLQECPLGRLEGAWRLHGGYMEVM
jgi:hypothetical protein